MKLLSYNIWGLGYNVKCSEVRDLILTHRVDFCQIQETKKEQVDGNFCRLLWGGGQRSVSVFRWAYRESVRRTRVLISIWDAEKFVVQSQWHMDGVIIVNGLWGSNRIQCCMINVYTPCLLSERIEMWDRLRSVALQNQDICCAWQEILIQFTETLKGWGEESARIERIQRFLTCLSEIPALLTYLCMEEVTPGIRWTELARADLTEF